MFISVSNNSAFANTCKIEKMEKKIVEACKNAQLLTAPDLLQLSVDKQNNLFLFENCGTSPIIVARLTYPHNILSFVNKPWKNNTTDFINFFDASGEMPISNFKKAKPTDSILISEGKYYLNLVPIKRKFVGINCLLKDNTEVVVFSSAIETSKNELLNTQMFDIDFKKWQTEISAVLSSNQAINVDEKNKFLRVTFEKIIDSNAQSIANILNINVGLLKITLKKKLESELRSINFTKQNNFEVFWTILSALENEITSSAVITREHIHVLNIELDNKLLTMQSKLQDVEKVITQIKNNSEAEQKKPTSILESGLLPLGLSVIALLLSLVSIFYIKKRL